MLVAIGVIAGTSAVHAPSAAAHPLHTTFAEVSLGASGHVEIRLRAFVDDFAAAVVGSPVALRPPFATPSAAQAERYLAGRLIVLDGAGRPATLVVTGLRRDGDVVWVTLRAAGVRSLAGLRLTNTVLFERYDDQVNVVQTNLGGRRHTILFTRRDGRAPRAIAA